MVPAVEINSIWKLYRLQRSGRAVSRTSVVRGESNDGADKAVAEGNAFWALRDVSLTIGVGEVVGIVGANGAGKSTLLKILSRITAPTRGTVRIHDSLVSLLEVGTGFHEELTGRENIALNATLLGMSSPEIQDKFDDIVDFAGIGQFIDEPVKHFSSGMRVRLGFSIAVHVEPKILIVDEVLAVGDAEFREKCRRRVTEMMGAHDRTVIVVSHSMGEIASLCSRVVLLEHGRIAGEGSPEDITQRYLESARKPVRAEVKILSSTPPAGKKEKPKPAAAAKDKPLQPNDEPKKTKADGTPKKVAPLARPDTKVEFTTPSRDEALLWHLTERTDRPSDTRMQFTDLSIANAAGERVASIGAGEQVTFNLGYVADPSVVGQTECYVNISIVDQEDERIFWMPSRVAHGPIMSLEAKGVLTCTIPQVPLVPGSYWINVWCLVEKLRGDNIRHAAQLNVHATNIFPGGEFPKPAYGNVFVRYAWDDTLAESRPAKLVAASP